MEAERDYSGNMVYMMPDKLPAPGEVPFTFNIDVSLLEIDKYFKPDEVDRFENEVLNYLIHNFMNNCEIKELDKELARSWTARFDAIFPNYRFNQKILAFFREIMNVLYLSCKKIAEENMKKAEHFHELPEVKEFSLNCSKILNYTEAMGKDFYRYGEFIGKYLYVQKDIDGFGMESNSHDKTISFPCLKVKVNSSNIHHFFFTHQKVFVEPSLALIKSTNIKIESNCKDYISAYTVSEDLDTAMRNKIMKMHIADGKPDYLELAPNKQIIDWATRVKWLDTEARQKQDEIYGKKLTLKSYQNIMLLAVEEYKNRMEGRALRDVYPPEVVLRHKIFGVSGTWENWYNEFLDFKSRGFTLGFLSDFFNGLEKVEEKKGYTPPPAGKIQLYPTWTT